jgi:hypothetical protein
MHSVLAMKGAAPLFRDALLASVEGTDPTTFARPEQVDDVEVCPISGMSRGPHCPAGRPELVDSRHPPGSCTWHEPGAKRSPPELLAFESQSNPSALATGTPILVASPLAGEEFVIDSLVPAESQAILLRALISVPEPRHVEWLVDGARVVTVDPWSPAVWHLEPGRHEIAAVVVFNEGGAEARASSPPVPIVVEES